MLGSPVIKACRDLGIQTNKPPCPVFCHHPRSQQPFLFILGGVSRGFLDASGEELWIIYAGVCADGAARWEWPGRSQQPALHESEAPGLRVRGCSFDLCPLAAQTREPSRGRRRPGAGWQRATPRRAAPSTGGARPILRRGTAPPGCPNGFG